MASNPNSTNNTSKLKYNLRSNPNQSVLNCSLSSIPTVVKSAAKLNCSPEISIVEVCDKTTPSRRAAKPIQSGNSNPNARSVPSRSNVSPAAAGTRTLYTPTSKSLLKKNASATLINSLRNNAHNKSSTSPSTPLGFKTRATSSSSSDKVSAITKIPRIGQVKVSGSHSVPASPVSTRDDTLIRDLLDLNSVLIDRVRDLEEELEQLKKMSEVNSKDSEVTSEDSPVTVSLDESSFSENVIDHIQPPPLAEISLLSVPESPAPLSRSSAPSTSHCGMKPRLLILGDSLARGLSDSLNTYLPNFSVVNSIHPGKTLDFILKFLPNLTSDFTMTDFVFILAGINNVPFLDPVSLKTTLSIYSSLFIKTNVIFSYIPYVFHKPCLNSNIFATNLSMFNFSSKFNFSVFNCNLFLARSMYTRHGLHFNAEGKTRYSHKLAQIFSCDSNFLSSPLILTKRTP